MSLAEWRELTQQCRNREHAEYLGAAKAWLDSTGRVVDCEMRVYLVIGGRDRRVLLRPVRGRVEVYAGSNKRLLGSVQP